jgi:hypothetical protein
MMRNLTMHFRHVVAINCGSQILTITKEMNGSRSRELAISEPHKPAAVFGNMNSSTGVGQTSTAVPCQEYLVRWPRISGGICHALCDGTGAIGDGERRAPGLGLLSGHLATGLDHF